LGSHIVLHRVFISSMPELHVSLLSFGILIENTNIRIAAFADLGRPYDRIHGHTKICS